MLMKKSFLLPNKRKKDTAAERKPYQKMTGLIMFLIVETKPDITYAMLVISYFTTNLPHPYSKAAKTIFRYLKAIRNIWITYGRKLKRDMKIKEYFNFDWLSNHVISKLTLWFVFMLNGRPISCCSEWQTTVTLLSTEAEYTVLTLIFKKAMWLKLLFRKLGRFYPTK